MLPLVENFLLAIKGNYFASGKLTSWRTIFSSRQGRRVQIMVNFIFLFWLLIL